MRGSFALTNPSSLLLRWIRRLNEKSQVTPESGGMAYSKKSAPASPVRKPAWPLRWRSQARTGWGPLITLLHFQARALLMSERPASAAPSRRRLDAEVQQACCRTPPLLRESGISVNMRCSMREPPSLSGLAPPVVIHPRSRRTRRSLGDTLVSYEHHCSCPGRIGCQLIK